MGDVAVVILAAGQGTRMASDKAKVLHEISGRPMIHYVVEAARAVAEDVVVVVGHQQEAVKRILAPYSRVRFAVQEEQLGTGHAVMAALPQLMPGTKDVVILCGDTPLIQPDTLISLIQGHQSAERSLTLLVTHLDDPHGYGRVVTDERGRAVRIVEESDADASQRQITLVNTGTYCVKVSFLERFLPTLDSQNEQGEFYLTDVVEHAYGKQAPAAIVKAGNAVEVLGVNTREDLAEAERLMNPAGP
jgi:UDP-N-acetylglucosamine diphosphorylase/glucosamine-1-phosphate N-acetyltransferase